MLLYNIKPQKMIQVKGLNKTFGEFKAIKNIQLNIKKGEIFGLLGPNGAGKSTLINIMSSVIKADSGTINLNGIDLSTHTNKSKSIIGIVPQEISLYENFSAYENLKFFGKLYGIEAETLKKRIEEILELIGLENRKNDLIKTYSGGMKRRINIAAALLHQPKILLMDEPTVGVDPQSRNQIFEVVEQLNKQGLTMIYTTHYMEEVERLCNRIAIMDSGEIIAQGTLEELQNQTKSKEKIEIEFKELKKEQKEKLKKEFTFPITFQNNKMKSTCNVKSNLNKILTYCVENQIKINEIHQEKVTLENIFLELTGKSLRD